MKINFKIISLFLICVLMMSGCSQKDAGTENGSYNVAESNEIPTGVVDLGDDNTAYGEAIEDIGVYEGYFEEDIVDVSIECVVGTEGAYSLEGNVLRFSEVSEDTVYSISGRLRGNIVIDTGDDHKFDLELRGLTLICDNTNPVIALSGNEISITAKNGYVNYIYDMRDAIDPEDETLYSGAIHSEVDLEICGNGALTVMSQNNNGIHSKDDLQVKNLTLKVVCTDNALKGNDSVEISGGTHTLIASQGDGVKTSNSDISEKSNQRGSVVLNDADITIYAACDGIDAAYNVVVDGENTNLNIYTDKYSNYSDEVTEVSSSEYYIRFTSDLYAYSVKYYNSDEDYVWVNAEYHSNASGNRSTYYYYSFPKLSQYQKIRFFIYSAEMNQGQEDEYLVASDYLALNESYDTFALTSRGSSLSYSWTNYTTNVSESSMGGPGGMGGGNKDKGSYSTKGIKAANEIIINAGSINIKSYDDAIHANNDGTLENGESPLGNVTVNGGMLTLYSNDDGLHADGTVYINAGTVCVSNSYEGVEGSCVNISGGYLSVISSDDGINSTATSGTGIFISGGTVYVYCTGDGLDANSRTSYEGISFSGGNTVVISNSTGNSAIDTEQGYKYTGGRVVAIMPRGGMSSEATHCDNFSSIGSSKSVSLASGSYLIAEIDGVSVTARIPCSISALVIVLGDNSPSVSTENEVSVSFDANGVCWQ